MPKSDGPIYGRVPFTCSAGAPFKPSNIIALVFVPNSEFDVQPCEWNYLYKCADQWHMYVHQLANHGLSIKPTQLPQNLHGRVVDWWYAVCLSVGSRTIRFHLVEWFSQIFHSLGCRLKSYHPARPKDHVDLLWVSSVSIVPITLTQAP
jgi:hypothetical protein